MRDHGVSQFPVHPSCARNSPIQIFTLPGQVKEILGKWDIILSNDQPPPSYEPRSLDPFVSSILNSDALQDRVPTSLRHQCC